MSTPTETQSKTTVQISKATHARIAAIARAQQPRTTAPALTEKVLNDFADNHDRKAKKEAGK